MSGTKWAEGQHHKTRMTTTTERNTLQNTKESGGMVSYEDLLIAQYLDELRRSRAPEVREHRRKVEKPSPYTQKLPHSDYTYKFRQRRPMSATYGGSSSSKPKIDAKFIADPSLWDPATPRVENTEKDVMVEVHMKRRPASAPVKRQRIRPWSAASTVSSYGRTRWAMTRPFSSLSGRRIRAQYKKQPRTVRVTAFKNGSRDVFIRIAAPNIKILLEYCTDKLNLPFAARRIFLEDGVEVFDEADISLDAEVYISMGENYKDPYATTKRNIILSNGAKWSLTGVMLPAEGKKKVSKPRLSKRMRQLAERKRVRIIVYLNGKSTDPMEIVADLNNLEEFLVACTAKLDLRTHARLLYDWEGNEIQKLEETPILDECLQSGGTFVLGPVWVSVGEGFSPIGTKNFLISVQDVLRTKLKEAKMFQKELNYMKDGEEDKVKVAVRILSMKKDEIKEALVFTESDIGQLKEALQKVKNKLEALLLPVLKEESEGSHYKMKHIKTIPEEEVSKFIGQTGIRLRVNENGTVNSPQDFYFNLQSASKGVSNEKELLLRRLLDDLSNSRMTANPQNPKLNPVAKKIFDQYGNEVTDVYKQLEYDQEIWVSFGEPFICPFTYCVQVIFDVARGKDILGEKQVILREQLTFDDIKKDMTDHYAWDATIGFPSLYTYEPCKPGEQDHVKNLAKMAEISDRNHYLQYKEDPKKVLYPEIIVNKKLIKGHKELWPGESQVWVVSKLGYIYCKPFPMLCLTVTDIHIDSTVSGGEKAVAYVVGLQKRMVGNPHQIWTFNTDATISSKAYPDQLLTFRGNKFGEEDDGDLPEGMKPGHRIYLVTTAPLKNKKDAGYQRFALKQERFDNLGQWKYTEAPNPEWNKQALSWPVRQDGSLNEDYDWPMEGYLIPNAPKLTKSRKKEAISGMTPLRLMVLKNGERDLRLSVPVVGPNLTNMAKDLNKKPEKGDKNRRSDKHLKSQENQDMQNEDSFEVDINLHCRDLTLRELEFIMFLDRCTSMLNLPFAARRLFDEKGNEHFSLQTLKRDQLVYLSCGEPWTDPKLTKAEQHRRFLLSQLAQDVSKIRQYCSLRNPEKYVLECDGGITPNGGIIVNREWSQEEEVTPENTASTKSTLGEETGPEIPPTEAQAWTAHEMAHQRAEERLNKLKWPWERLVNVNNSLDLEDTEAMKYTDRELYERYKPRPVQRVPRDYLQRFVYEDGYIACATNRNLVLGAAEPEGRIVPVTLVKRRPDDIYQLWVMKPNGEIRSRYNQQLVLTVNMPNNEPYAEDEDGRPLTFVGCSVTLQSRKLNQYGKAHQRWRYDAETGFIHAFCTDLPDKEITAANKADVCTYAIASNSKIDQPGYVVEVPLPVATERGSHREIMVCMSCARAMRGRYKLNKLPPNVEFSCAMGNAKKLKLQQIGSFCVLNGKVDLSTHEYQLTLQQWEEKLAELREQTTRVIVKEVNATKTVQTVKVLCFKNGEGRLRPGEIVCGSSIEGLLNQCTHRLGLTNAARRIYTEDGTLVVEIEDLVDWAVENYRSLMADHLERLYQEKEGTVSPEFQDNRERPGQGQQERGQGEGQDSMGEETDAEKEAAEVDQKEADKAARKREYLLSQVQLPPVETILRYPIEVWVSSGKPFVAPEVVESKLENRKKKRQFRSTVSMELDIEKHVLRQMKGRRLEGQDPGEYRSTKNTLQPVVVEGHWQEPTAEEQVKHDTVHKLQTHLAEVKANQGERIGVLNVNLNKKLYQQPNMKRVQVFPNGESVERAVYAWGESIDQLLDSSTIRLNLWQRAKKFYTMDGKQIETFDDIDKDQILCVSTGKPFKPPRTSMHDIEIKANWSRAHKQYGQEATDVNLFVPKNPKVNVDPFGPPELALPPTGDQQKAIKTSPAPGQTSEDNKTTA